MAKRNRRNTPAVRVPLTVRDELDAIRQRERRTKDSYPYGRIIGDLIHGRVHPLRPGDPPPPSGGNSRD